MSHILAAFLALGAASEPPGLEPIVIVAERAATPGQDVPIAVDVVDAERLQTESLVRIDDLAGTLPALQFKSIFGSSAPQLYIRGVGNTDVNPSANPGVAVYLDDTLISSPLGQSLVLFDLQRAELLKGPQGTLFGRNATGGALVLVTPAATADRGGSVEVLGGSDGLRGGSAIINSGTMGPVRLRLAGTARASDGTTANSVGPRLNELDEQAVRLTAEVTFSPRWSGRMVADVASDRSTMTGHVGRGLFDPAALAASVPGGPPNIVSCSVERVLASACANLLGYVYAVDPYSSSSDQPGREDLNAGGISLRLERDGPVRFRSLTAWRRGERDVLQDADASPLSLAELGFENTQTTVTQEVLIDAVAGRLEWRAGAFWLTETLDTVNRYNTLQSLRSAGVPFNPDPALFFFGPFRLAQTYRQENRSVAGFVDADYALSPQLTASAGLRLTRERTEFRTETRFAEAITTAAIAPLRADAVEDDQSAWRLALRYAPSRELAVYGSISTGFKSANFNGGALFPFDALGPVAAERLTAVEWGLKAQPSQTLRIEAALYHYTYDGLQTFTFRPSPPPTRQVLDSGDAEVTGLDASVTALLPLGLEARFSGTWLDAAFTGFVDANGVNRSGNPLPNAPNVAWSAGLSGTSAISSVWQMGYGVNANYRSNVSFDTTNAPLLRSDARLHADARIALIRPESGLTLSVEVANLTDERVLIDALNIAEYGLIQQTYGLPRSVNLRVTKQF